MELHKRGINIVEEWSKEFGLEWTLKFARVWKANQEENSTISLIFKE